MMNLRKSLKVAASALILTALSVGCFGAQAAPPIKDVKFAAGRILVKGKPGLDDSRFLTILSHHGGQPHSKIGETGVHIIKVPPGLEKKIVAELTADTAVDFAELDQLVEASFLPNDPSFGGQWHHTTIGSQAAWDGASAAGITIAILDTGVESTHPDLAAVLVTGWNIINQNTDTSPANNHGTNVAGTAGAVFNNGIGVSGVSRDAKIMPIRISNDTSSVGYAYWSDIANAVTWATNHGARVVSNSYSSYQAGTVVATADILRSKGGLMVTSAGNEGSALTFSDNSIIVVSATDSTDTKTGWSNYGPMIDVAAPGAGIYTTTTSGGYGSVNGTSFSAPMTAGLIALIMGVNPLLSADDVETILKSTAVDLGGAGRDDLYGSGRINAAAAIAKAKTFVPTTTDTTEPTVAINEPLAENTVAGLVPVSVVAADNVGITRVDLMVNGALYASDTSSPFDFIWDTSSLGNIPSITLSAVAVDKSGNKATSSGVSVKVQNIIDTAPPTIIILNPASGIRVTGTVTIKATATDNIGITSAQLLIDGKVIQTVAGSSISYSWNTKKVKVGSHAIAVIAKDASGNTTTSQISVLK